jgi:hypothetical protein
LDEALVFERDDSDTVVFVALDASDGPGDPFLVDAAPSTRGGAVSVVMTEEPAAERPQEGIRRVRVVADGSVRLEALMTVDDLHRQLLAWWRGEALLGDGRDIRA